MWKKIKGFIAKEWLLLFIIAADFVSGMYLWPKLPNNVPMHWNVYGQVDRYGSKEWAAFGFPCLLLGIYLLMLILPKIDPKKKNYNLFEGTYNIIRVVILLVFTAFHGITTAAALGYSVKIDKAAPLIIAVMFVVFGNYMGKVRQNFFMGVKTPWTLSDPDIWTKTHRLTGKLWAIGGLVLIASSLVFSGTLSFVIFITITLVLAFLPVLYSYQLFRQKK